MRQRGRKSSAELSTVVIDAGLPMPSSPPPELTDAQAIEPDMQISRIRLSDKTSRLRFRVQRHLQLLNIYRS
jgi:hypothetical protein